MASKVFHIELRCPGLSDPKKQEALKRLTSVIAQQWFGGALLVTGNDTPPAIAAYSEDFIVGQEEILAGQTEEESSDD